MKVLKYNKYSIHYTYTHTHLLYTHTIKYFLLNCILRYKKSHDTEETNEYIILLYMNIKCTLYMHTMLLATYIVRTYRDSYIHRVKETESISCGS